MPKRRHPDGCLECGAVYVNYLLQDVLDFSTADFYLVICLGVIRGRGTLVNSIVSKMRSIITNNRLGNTN